MPTKRVSREQMIRFMNSMHDEDPLLCLCRDGEGDEVKIECRVTPSEEKFFASIKRSQDSANLGVPAKFLGIDEPVGRPLSRKAALKLCNKIIRKAERGRRKA